MVEVAKANVLVVDVVEGRREVHPEVGSREAEGAGEDDTRWYGTPPLVPVLDRGTLM